MLADAAVSVFVVLGLTAAYLFGWLFLDPLAALVGALVIASWSYQLIRDTGAVLLDVNPDPGLAARLRASLEREGDAMADLHLWRLGPGHLGAILCVETASDRDAADYRRAFAALAEFAHLTVEVVRVAPPRPQAECRARGRFAACRALDNLAETEGFEPSIGLYNPITV